MKRIVNHLISRPKPRREEVSHTVFAPQRSIERRETTVFDAMLSSGGDESLVFDPFTGRNRYGVPQGSAQDEVWLSSSTASAASVRGRAAALAAFERVTRAGDAAPLPLPAWFDDIRQRLHDLFAAQGSEIVLSSSDAATELVVIAVAQAFLSRPLTSLVFAPPESSRDSGPVEGDRHFSAFLGADHRVISLDLRDRYGVPLDCDLVDRIVADHAKREIAAGRDVLLHLLDCSETGRSGPTRTAALALAAAHPGHVLTAVDAGQLRCSPGQVRSDLDSGFIVTMTGSKFAGGPTFSGAILLPRQIVEKLADPALSPELAACSAALDWSPRLRDRLRGEFSALASLGLGLRWECALAELAAFFAIDEETRQRIAARFALEVHAHLAASPQLKLADRDWRESDDLRTIFPILAFDDHGRAISAAKLHRALANPVARRGRRAGSEPAIHLGQPISIGAMDALRVCLGAQQVNAVADRLRQAMNFDAAFQPLADELAVVFGRWNELAARDL